MTNICPTSPYEDKDKQIEEKNGNEKKESPYIPKDNPFTTQNPYQNSSDKYARVFQFSQKELNVKKNSVLTELVEYSDMDSPYFEKHFCPYPYLLQENGDFLLQENNGKIIL